jgi:hypothetical protein
MYDVEVMQPFVQPSITYPLNEMIDAEWEDMANIPQLESDAEEYQEAKAVAVKLREYYTRVRVVKILPGGLREVVRECPFDFSHTREWCGFPECRES